MVKNLMGGKNFESYFGRVRRQKYLAIVGKDYLNPTIVDCHAGHFSPQ